MNGAEYKWVLLCASALVTAASMLCLQQTWMLLIICFVPIFYLVLSNHQLTFATGFVWGVVFWSAHLISFAHVLVAYGSGSLRLVGYLFFVVYLSLYSGLWHASIALANRYIAHYVMGWRTLWAIVATLLYYHLLFYHAFFIFGVHTGYCLALPTVALYSINSMMVHLLGGWPFYLLSIMLAINAAVAACMVNRSYLRSVLLITTIAAILSIQLSPQTNHLAQHLYQTVGYCCPPHAQDPIQLTNALADALYQLDAAYPELETIVMPESSIGYCIDQYPWIIDEIQRARLSKRRRLIAGTFRSCEAHLHNSILFATDNCISVYYDKIIPLPFTECVPWFWNRIGIINELFLSGKKSIRGACGSACAEIIRQTTDKSPYQLTEHVLVEPFICSDLFFNTGNNGDGESTVVLFCVKDSWFPLYYRRLLFGYAQMVSITWRRPVLYVSYAGAFLMQKGYKTCQLRAIANDQSIGVRI